MKLSRAYKESAKRWRAGCIVLRDIARSECAHRAAAVARIAELEAALRQIAAVVDADRPCRLDRRDHCHQHLDAEECAAAITYAAVTRSGIDPAIAGDGA